MGAVTHASRRSGSGRGASKARPLAPIQAHCTGSLSRFRDDYACFRYFSLGSLLRSSPDRVVRVLGLRGHFASATEDMGCILRHHQSYKSSLYALISGESIIKLF